MKEKAASLRFGIEINASPENVWAVMLELKSYKEWVKAFSPSPEFRGEWIERTHIDFIDPTLGGTKALLEKVERPREVLARHVAVLDKEGQPDLQNEVATAWIGTTEQYLLHPTDTGCQLTILMNVDPSFEAMFSLGWPEALKRLKALCEQS